MSRAEKVSVAILLSFVLFLFIALPAAHAQGIPKQIVPETCTGPTCDCGDLVKLASNILNTGIYIAVILSAILFAWAGIQYVTNAANPEGKNRAKEVLRNVIIGLVVILAAWLIVDTLMKTLQVKLQGTGAWNAICG